MSGMELSHMRALVAVAEHGSMTAAAEEMYLSSVSLMRQINQIENELGFQVFNRSRKGCTLTHDGEEFYRELKTILLQLDALLAKGTQRTQPEVHKLRVCLYKPYEFMELLENYRKSCPEQVIQYDTWETYDPAQRHEWMKARKLDILQTGYSPMLEKQGLTFLPIREDRYSCFFTQELPLASKEQLTVEDLKGYDVYSFSDASYIVDEIERHFIRAECALKRIPFSDSSVLGKCSKGGVFILEESLKKVYPHLCSVPLAPAWPCVHGIVYFTNKKRNLRDFLNYISNCVGKENVAAMMATLKERYSFCAETE